MQTQRSRRWWQNDGVCNSVLGATTFELDSSVDVCPLGDELGFFFKSRPITSAVARPIISAVAYFRQHFGSSRQEDWE
jgi:hypothetical protein